MLGTHQTLLRVAVISSAKLIQNHSQLPFTMLDRRSKLSAPFGHALRLRLVHRLFRCRVMILLGVEHLWIGQVIPSDVAWSRGWLLAYRASLIVWTPQAYLSILLLAVAEVAVANVQDRTRLQMRTSAHETRGTWQESCQIGFRL